MNLARTFSFTLALLLTGPVAAADGPTGAPALAPVPVVSVPTFGNATCPIMGKPASLALFTDTEFGRIYVCCPPCNRKIQLDPARAYKVAYPTTRAAGNTTCPITGKPVDGKSQTVLLQGNEIRVCSADCVAKAKANAQVTLVKATRPGTVDIGNTVCPITGGPVAPNAFCLIGDALVHLSSPTAVEAVRRDPSAALQTARASVKRLEPTVPASPAPVPTPSK